MNYFNRWLIYRQYKKNLRRALYDINHKYNFTVNLSYDFYTVLDLSDVPEQLKQEYGVMWKQIEINKFMSEIQNELDKYNIIEELGIIEIIKINEITFGITFGIKRSIFNSTSHIISMVLSILSIIIIGLIILI